MRNCFHLCGRARSAQTPGPSKTNKASSASAPSSFTTSSNPSTITAPSSTEKSTFDGPPTRTESGILASSNLKDFAFIELKNATRNFRPESRIGEGGFGFVYKGWLDEQTLAASKPGVGMAVAVKKLKPESFQGHKEWLAEVHYLGQFRHPNLVRLIGYCLDEDNRLLVYELMPNGNLENHLFRRSNLPLSWATRINIAVGAARGLSFLHHGETQVIYRDVKSSNILLDLEFNPKLSDFGLAKDGPTGGKTHVSTRVMGTQGYAAPEYIATGRLSVKADVYSFGVVLLEMLSGRRAIDRSKTLAEQDLVEWAKRSLDDRRMLVRIMDPKLEGQYPKKQAQMVAAIVSRCIINDAKARPSMSEVLAILEKLQVAQDLEEEQEKALSPMKSPIWQRLSSGPRRSPSRPH